MQADRVKRGGGLTHDPRYVIESSAWLVTSFHHASTRRIQNHLCWLEPMQSYTHTLQLTLLCLDLLLSVPVRITVRFQG